MHHVAQSPGGRHIGSSPRNIWVEWPHCLATDGHYPVCLQRLHSTACASQAAGCDMEPGQACTAWCVCSLFGKSCFAGTSVCKSSAGTVLWHVASLTMHKTSSTSCRKSKVQFITAHALEGCLRFLNGGHRFDEKASQEWVQQGRGVGGKHLAGGEPGGGIVLQQAQHQFPGFW